MFSLKILKAHRKAENEAMLLSCDDSDENLSSDWWVGLPKAKDVKDIVEKYSW